MRQDSSTFAAKNLAKSKLPRYTIEMAFREKVTTGTAQSATASTLRLAASTSAITDAYANMVVEITSGTGSGQKRAITAYDDVTKDITLAADWTTIPDDTSVYRIDDLYYLTSHAQADSAIVTGAPVTYNVIEKLAGTSQQISPDEGRATIGAISYSVVDKSSALTSKIYAKLAAGYGLKGKRVRFYLGYDGLTWDDYCLIQTQIVDSISFNADGSYAIQCADVNRSVRTDIFDPKTTTLSKSITATQLLIPVYTVTGFGLVAHGSSYSDAPNASVGYIQVEKEVIRWTSTTTDDALGLCFVVDQRGALNTVAVAHQIDATATADRRTKVTEYFYLEMPAPKLAYAILTGTLYGQGASLPSNWCLGISTDYVKLSDFTGIGADWWNTSDDGAGFIVRFEGLKKQDAKKFLEQEIYMLLGAFSPIYSTGELGLKRMSGVLAGAAYVDTLNEDNVVAWTALKHDMQSVINEIQIDWNWDALQGKFTRTNLLIDADSINVHGAAKLKNLKFLGLHGSRHSYAALTTRFNAYRDRYSGPPMKFDATLLPSKNVLEVGDVVRVQPPNMRDFVTGTTFDRSMEVQAVKIDWITGKVTVSLFGSSQAASTLTPDSTGASGNGTGTPPLNDTWYSSAGTSLVTYLAANYPANYTDAGGILTITGNVTLPGNASLASAIYYYDGDLTINPGVTVSITQNVEIRYKGHLTLNGKIDGKGAGLTGTSPAGLSPLSLAGQAGYLGTTQGAFGIDGGIYMSVLSPPPALAIGLNASVPPLDVYTTNGVLSGLPDDIRGTSGGTGNSHSTALPGAGGAGGPGLLLIGRGMSTGVSAQIDLSGDDGLEGQMFTNGDGTVGYGGSGCGGAPGAFILLLDGANSVLPDLGVPLISQYGAIPIPVGDLSPPGLSGFDMGEAAYRVQYLPENTSAAANVDQPPADVANLRLNYIAGLAQLWWDAVSDTNSIDYEVRSGADWATGRVLGRTPITNYPYQGNGTYWVAARYIGTNAQSVYSANPASIVITGGAIVTNVLASYDEQALGWTGTISGGAGVDGNNNLVLTGSGDMLAAADYLALTDVLNYGGISASGSYAIPSGHRVNAQRVAACNVTINATVAALDITDDILSVADVLAVSDYLHYGLINKIAVTPQVRLAQADGVYGAWQNYIPGVYVAQHVDAQALLESFDADAQPQLTALTFQVDIPTLTYTGTAVDCPAAGLGVAFTSQFNQVPNVHVSILNAQAGDLVTFPVQPTVSGFTVKITNGGVGVDRSINWSAEAY